MEEIWKDLKRYDSLYMVSNLGNVFSKRSNRLMLKNKNNRGYERVTIFGKQLSVHRLVAMEFLDNYSDKKYVNHINGIKTDNNIDNIEMVTARENSIHYLSSKQIKEIKLKTCVRYERWISINGKNRRIGRFKTIEEANKAYFDKLKEIPNSLF